MHALKFSPFSKAIFVSRCSSCLIFLPLKKTYISKIYIKCVYFDFEFFESKEKNTRTQQSLPHECIGALLMVGFSQASHRNSKVLIWKLCVVGKRQQRWRQMRSFHHPDIKNLSSSASKLWNFSFTCVKTMGKIGKEKGTSNEVEREGTRVSEWEWVRGWENQTSWTGKNINFVAKLKCRVGLAEAANTHILCLKPNIIS